MAHTAPTVVADALIVPTEDFTGAAVTAWRATLASITDGSGHRLVIDLSHAPTIDAEGIALLVDTHRRLVGVGGELIVRAPNPRIRRLLTIARVNGVLTIEPPCADEQPDPDR